MALLLCCLISCSDEEEEIPRIDDNVSVEDTAPEKVEEPLDQPVQEEIPEELPDPNKTEISFTTGLPCTPEEKIVRPIAVMYNNIKVSLPQNEISKADVVYECDAEGGITRLMAIFSDWKNLGEIGSVRSSRDYFVSLSESHGAIYVHAGGSPSAYEKLINTDVDYVDGVNMNYLPKNTFYRNKDRIRNNGYEHSMMTDGEKLSTAINQLGYKTETDIYYAPPYSFNTEFTSLNGEKAESITLEHSSYVTVNFEYDGDSATYLKYSYGEPHIDGTNEEQLSFTNVIVLFVKERVLDEQGRLDVDLTSGGSGYYFSGGECIDVTWSRSSDNSPFVITARGEEVKLNPGKTHITLFNRNYKENVTKE